MTWNQGISEGSNCWTNIIGRRLFVSFFSQTSLNSVILSLPIRDGKKE